MNPAADAKASLDAGDLDGALARLQEAVRAAPGEARLRLFLFQLFAVRGDWSRAARQLDVLVELDPSAELLGEVYRPALHAEAERAEVFGGRARPAVLGEPEPWMAQWFEALRLTAAGEHAAAAAVREEALDAALDALPEGGTLDGAGFAWIADADARFGPMLEAVVGGRYLWLPFARTREMRVEPPVDLRDLVWLPVRFTWTNGGEAVGLVPSRYPGSEAETDSGLRLARRTEWRSPGEGVQFGLGQRMLMTDAGDHPLFEIRCVTFPNGAGDG